jgi:hypothetical protein
MPNSSLTSEIPNGVSHCVAEKFAKFVLYISKNVTPSQHQMAPYGKYDAISNVAVKMSFTT